MKRLQGRLIERQRTFDIADSQNYVVAHCSLLLNHKGFNGLFTIGYRISKAPSLKIPPDASTRIAFLPFANPSTAPPTYLKVLPARTTWSIHAFREEGIPKFHMGQRPRRLGNYPSGDRYAHPALSRRNRDGMVRPRNSDLLAFARLSLHCALHGTS